MSYIADLERYGQPWSVSLDLNAAGTQTIATPTGLRRDPTGSHIAGDRCALEMGLVILGFSWDVNCDAVDQGFYLISRGNDNISRIRYRVINKIDPSSIGSATKMSGCVSPCWIPAQPADARLSPSQDGESFFVQTVGTPLGQSNILVWGIHTSMDFGKFYTGSPAIFPTA